MSRLLVYSRHACGLCDELLEELVPWAEARALSLQVRDVDADPLTRRRYGLRIPAVLLDGEPVCYGHLDLAALERALLASG